MSHTLFRGGLVLPEFVGILHPGLTAFDGLLGLPVASLSSCDEDCWMADAINGVYYLAMSNVAPEGKRFWIRRF